MKSNKYLHSYLMFMGLFCTIYHDTIASEEAQANLQQATTPDTRTQDFQETQNQDKNNITTPLQAVCPHAQTPVEKLNEEELKELLDCTQQQKFALDKTVEKIQSTLDEKSTSVNKKSKKIKKHKDRCPYYNIPLRNLKADQLEEVYEYTKTHKMDAPFIIDLLTRLIALSHNHAGVKQYKLELADIHYNVHHIEKAAACYEDFAVLYPGSQETEYVLYKALACMFELSLDADRDQTNTKKTIVLIKEFLKHAKKQELIAEAKSILQICYDRLYEHEVYVFNFYLKKKNFEAAQLRLNYIKKSFTQTIPAITEKAEALAQQLDTAKNPIKKSFWSLLTSEEKAQDKGPVNTTTNKAAKFLA